MPRTVVVVVVPAAVTLSKTGIFWDNRWNSRVFTGTEEYTRAILGSGRVPAEQSIRAVSAAGSNPPNTNIFSLHIFCD
jgi:hypothetical protein